MTETIACVILPFVESDTAKGSITMQQEITKEKLEAIMKKIAALKKFSVANTTKEEAANAAAKLQELLMKYNLELSDIQDETYSSGIDSDIIKSGKENWQQHLMNALAGNNFCDMVITAEGMALFGLSYNREIVTHMYFSLINQLALLAKVGYKDYFGNA